MDPQQLSKFVTEQELRSLLVRERYYRDTSQWAKLRSCYHADNSKTTVKISWFSGDINGFVEGSERMTKGGAAATHTICPVEIMTHGNRAATESTGTVMIRFKHEGIEYDCTSYTRFLSRLEKVDGEWKFLTLEATYEKDTIIPSSPQSTQVKLPINPEYRPSYNCIAWVLAQKGFSIAQDLPGSDVPGSCEKLQEENIAWLHSGP